MVIVNYQDQLQPGTFEYAIQYLVDHKLDLCVFHPRFKNDSNGRPAYDPAILLKIVLFAYSKGITSSREIQWCCENNIIFKALSCDSVPHWTTIASFISSQPSVIEKVFEQILLVCHEEGLLGNELFAIDGCKMSSDAAKEWSGKFSELEEKREKLKRQIRFHMSEQERLDKLDLDQDRIARADKTIGTLNSSLDKIDEFLGSNSPRMGKSQKPVEVKSNITDNESAKMKTSKGTIQGFNGVATVDKKHQIIIDATAFGEGQEYHTLAPVLDKVSKRYKRLGINDDIYSTGVVVTADTGFSNQDNMKYLYDEQINAYIPDNNFRKRDKKFTGQKKKYVRPSRAKKDYVPILPSSEFSFDPINKSCICPAGNEMRQSTRTREQRGYEYIAFEGSVPKCRQCELKTKCMRNPDIPYTKEGRGRQVSFRLDKQRKPNYLDWMKRRIDSPKGKQLYSHRMSVVEPVFGNIGTNKGLSRFTLRGLDKVNGQWKLFGMIHNIEKLKNYGSIAV